MPLWHSFTLGFNFYFPSYGSSSGSSSLHNFKNILNIKFCLLKFVLKLYGNRLILLLWFLLKLIYQTHIWDLFYTQNQRWNQHQAWNRNQNQNRNLRQDLGASSDCGKMIIRVPAVPVQALAPQHCSTLPGAREGRLGPLICAPSLADLINLSSRNVL